MKCKNCKKEMVQDIHNKNLYWCPFCHRKRFEQEVEPNEDH